MTFDENTGPCRLIIVAGKDTVYEPSGGHSSYVRAHARAAQAAGFQPEIYCVSHLKGTATVDYGLLRRVTSIPGLSPRRYRRVKSRNARWHAYRIQRALIRDLKNETRPIILHGIGIWGMAATRAAARLRRRGRTVCSLVHIYTCHNEEYRSKLEGAHRSYGLVQQCLSLYEYLLGYLLISSGEVRMCRDADFLVGNYESVRRYIEKNHGPMPEYRVVTYAAEPAFLTEPESLPVPADVMALQPADAPLIVSLSRHDPRKGLDVLIEALALLNERGVPFRACIASAGELLQANKDLARRMKLPAGQVSFPGFVPDPLPYLYAADIYCLPSFEEHSGSVSLLEALQVGCASVSSDVDGMSEDVEHEQHALLVPPRDPVALADALQRLIEDPALRARLAAGARQRFEERFSAAAITRAMKSLYDECIAFMEKSA
jgi:glycosyltransferase involved in cell wall biosynthesis